MSRLVRRLLLVGLGLTALALPAARPYGRAAALVIQAADIEGWPSRATGWQLGAYMSSDITIPTRAGNLAARIYRPTRTIRQTIMVVPGVHAAGMDEPRLVGFARNLAGLGAAVVTIDLPQLKTYRITPQSTDQIEDAARWVADQPELAPEQQIGLMGISFGGGLSVVAAGRPSLDGRLSFVLSFGGHGDFGRVLDYLCTGWLPDGSFLPPHDYGVVIILLNVAERLLPAEQTASLRRGILMFLNASHLAMVDHEAAEQEFARAREFEATLPEPAAELMHAVNTRDVKTLGARLLPHLSEYAAQEELSPERSRTPRTTVYLLHGTDDNVIPASESRLLASQLEPNTTVHLLVTPLITHAEVDRAMTVPAIWNLISFWAGPLAE